MKTNLAAHHEIEYLELSQSFEDLPAIKVGYNTSLSNVMTEVIVISVVRQYLES